MCAHIISDSLQGPKGVVDETLTIKGRNFNHKVDIDKALELRLKGLSYEDIAKHFGVTKQAIHTRIAHLIPDTIDIEAGEKHLGKILLSDLFRYRKFLTDEKLQKAPAGTLTLMICQTFDKYRTQTGQSNYNHSVFSRVVEAACNDNAPPDDKLLSGDKPKDEQ